MKKEKVRQRTITITAIIVAVAVTVLICMLLFYPKLKPEKEKIIKRDTIAPTINGIKDLETYKDEEIDLLEGITASDNETKNIKVTVDGTYFFDVVGEYRLYYIAKDESGNTTKESFTLTVKEKEVIQNEETGAMYIDGNIIVNKTYGVPSTFEPENLVYVGKAQMVDYAANAMQELINAAASEGYTIFTMTGYRSYGFQASIYNGYLKEDSKENVDTYSARPGYSEHHTGLAVDVNSLNQSWGETPEGIWLNENCYKYGFIIRYPYGKDEITGYMYEPWHIRYIGKDLAEKLYNNGNWITIEEYYNLSSKYE